MLNYKINHLWCSDGEQLLEGGICNDKDFHTVVYAQVRKDQAIDAGTIVLGGIFLRAND
jgi:hypothetical protein